MISSAAPAKFTFDLDLGRRAERNSVVTESAMATMLADARTAGFAEGFAAGEQGIAAKAAKTLATSATALADSVSAMSTEIDDSRKATLGGAVELAAMIARKLAGALVDREPAAEIEALIAECLASLDGVPHLVIRCNTELADAVREIAQARMATSGFTGRLVVMGDPEIQLGDGRIEWVDGGVVRDMAQLTTEIDSRISAFLAARGIKQDAIVPEETDQ